MQCFIIKAHYRKKMVQFYWEENKSYDAAIRRWRREFGNGHCPTKSTIRYNLQKFKNEDISSLANQHKFVEKPKTVATPAVIQQFHQEIVQSYNLNPLAKGPSCRRNNVLAPNQFSTAHRILSQHLGETAYRIRKV